MTISYLRSMILYNVTVIVEEDAHEEWLAWMKDIHIPDVMATGCFVSQRLLRVLDSPNEGVTYCVQYIADSPEQYERYRDQFAPDLQADLARKFENRYVAFRTLMEFVD